jgi:hypothetical protein
MNVMSVPSKIHYPAGENPSLYERLATTPELTARELILTSESRIRKEVQLSSSTRHYTKAIRAIRPNVCIRV